MRNFLIQLFKFICPIIILVSLPSYILWKSKESFYKIDKLLKSKERYLIGYAYDENKYSYLKWTYLSANERKNIWALGSSRVLQFRKEMFDVSFYNAGYTISSLNDFKPFLKSIPVTKYPKFIIIGLDQWMFNVSWDSLNSVPPVKSWQNSFKFYPQSYTYRSVYKDLINGKFNVDSFQKGKLIDKIGLNAIVNNKGFRNDGSIYYGDQITKLINHCVTAEDYGYLDTFDRIKQGNRRFEYGKSVNKKALLELNELLKYCKNNKIEIIGFLPPFADEVYSKMYESNNYNYLKEIYNKVKPIFDKYNYEIYDFSNVSLCNSNDHETIDGFHGGELTYQKLLIKMLDSGSILNQVTNVKRLKTDLSKNINNYIIYSY